MKTETLRNSALALVGFGALSIYILACTSTSFSPDDTKVLYTAFDGTNGAVGVAVYERATAHSDLAFVPATISDSDTNHAKPALMRSQWLADGQRILVSWGGDNDSDGLTLAVMPWNVSAPLRLFNLPKIEGLDLTRPLCVAGDRVFLMVSKQQILRLDLKTGAVVHHMLEGVKSEITLLPVPNDSGVFYAEDLGKASGTVFGRLNPDDFTLTPLASFTNDFEEQTFFAYDPAGRRCAFLEKAADLPRLPVLEGGKTTELEPSVKALLSLPQLVVLEGGKEVFRRFIGAKDDELSFASAVFSKQGDSLLAGFRRKHEGQGAAYGLMEIPLDDKQVRETVLISGAAAGDKESAFYFQFGISHDGKTAAVSSTYLACATEPGFKPEDCALFFIDLSDPARKVTKVPIPIPAWLGAPAGK